MQELVIKKIIRKTRRTFLSTYDDDEIDSDGKRHNQVKANNENTEHKKQNIENSVHEKKMMILTTVVEAFWIQNYEYTLCRN